jgi:hypothetical protein
MLGYTTILKRDELLKSRLVSMWQNQSELVCSFCNTRDGINWVDFRYENLPMFCFACGLVGHNEDQCSNPTLPLAEGGVNPRGPWLRSNIYGKRINENRDKRFNSNPMKSVSGGQFSPIPQAMIYMLAKMKLEEENMEQDKPEDPNNPTNLHQQSPTLIKRKFQKTQSSSQIHIGMTSPTSTQAMVSPLGKANQGK